MTAVYRALFTSQVQLFSQYRVAMFVYVLFSFVRPVIFLAAWLAVAEAQGGSVGEFSRGDLAAYFVAATLVNHLTASWNMFDFEFEVRQGRLSAKLLRPLHVLHYAVVENFVWKMFTLLAVVPVLVLIAWTFRPTFEADGADIAIGAVSVVLGAALTFLFGWTVALVAFWTTRIHAAVTLYQRAAFIFAGQIAPLGLLPGVLQTIAYALPFGYMLGVPADILRGGHEPSAALLLVAGQVFWLGVAALLFAFVWRHGVRQYTAVGA